jgi:histidine triad (HIT) family protein
MPSIFSRIIQGEIPCYKIAEDDRFFAFLDINPLTRGHTLVVPKKETDYLFDIADQDLADMMVFSKKIARAIQQVIPCERIGVAVIGLEVPHAHIHLVPLKNMGDLNFANPKLKLSKEEFTEIAEKIRNAV